MPACSWISWLQSELGEETALGTESAHPPRGHGTSCGIDVLSLLRNPRSLESPRSSEGMQPCSRSPPLTGAWSGQQSGMPFSSSLHGLTTLLFVPVEGWEGVSCLARLFWKLLNPAAAAEAAHRVPKARVCFPLCPSALVVRELRRVPWFGRMLSFWGQCCLRAGMWRGKRGC